MSPFLLYELSLLEHELRVAEAHRRQMSHQAGRAGSWTPLRCFGARVVRALRSWRPVQAWPQDRLTPQLRDYPYASERP